MGKQNSVRLHQELPQTNTDRHGPACPGHRCPGGAAIGGPDKPGHDDGGRALATARS